jgi:hypothetical protein
MMKMMLRLLFTILAIALAGCFHQAVATRPAAPDKNSVHRPYDEVWDATMRVIKDHQLKVQAQDPAHGIIEAQGRHFTLQDADCGMIGTPLGKSPAEPTDEATTVFNFYLAPDGPEATDVSIQATFSTPGNAPFHPTTNLNCISKGRQEALMLKQIKEAAAQQQRPVYRQPQELNPSPAELNQAPNLTPHGQLLLKPDQP